MIEPLARDDDALDLSGSLVNLQRKRQCYRFPDLRARHSASTDKKTIYFYLVNLGVAHEFLHRVLGVEAVAAEDLDGVRRRLVRHVRRETLRDRRVVAVTVPLRDERKGVLAPAMGLGRGLRGSWLPPT